MNDRLQELENLLAAEVQRCASIDDAAALAALLESTKVKLWGSVLTQRLSKGGQEGGAGSGDRLLSVDEAADLLSTSTDDLYRNDYPFKLKLSGRLRFSWLGIQEYIQEKRLDGQTAGRL